jgi:tetratricopeptide (TPR) repeat protein
MRRPYMTAFNPGIFFRRVLRFAFPSLLAVAVAAGLSSCGDGAKLTNDQLLQNALDAASGPKADWQKARALAAKAVKQNQNDARAHVMLALSLEQCGQINSAIDEIRKAVALDRKNFLALFTNGRMLFENDRIGDCIAPLKEAYRLQPDNDNVLVLLARSSARLERFKEAAGYFATLARRPMYKDKPEPLNEIGVLYVKQKDYPKALAFFNAAYKIAPNNHIVVLNLGILYDTHLKSPANAVKFYNKYQELTMRNPELEPLRNKLKRRIEVLKDTNML